MTIGSPIDPSIRRLIVSSKSDGFSLPDTPSNLDPTPQLIMNAGSEQFSFQYPDNLGDGRDQYTGYVGAGIGAQNATTSIPTATPAAPGLVPTLSNDPNQALNGQGFFAFVSPSYRGALVRKIVGQIVPGPANVVINFGTELIDTDNIVNISSSDTKFVIPVGVSKVRFYIMCLVFFPTIGIQYAFNVFKNGAGVYGNLLNHTAIDGIGFEYMVVSPVMTCVPGDYFEAGFTNSSTPSVELHPATHIEMQILG